jgi:hypothetical protein
LFKQDYTTVKIDGFCRKGLDAAAIVKPLLTQLRGAAQAPVI